MITQLCLAVFIAVFVSALCSIFEAVLYSVPHSQIEIMKQSGTLRGRMLYNLKKDIHKPITAILTLNTIANTMGAAVAGASAAAVFGEQNLAWFSVIFTVTILIFSEILPKTVGVIYSQKLAGLIALPVNWLVKILLPVIWLCNKLTKLIPGNDNESLVSAEEVKIMAMLSRKSGEIDPQQERIIKNIIGLKGRIVREAMTPRTVTFTLNQNLSVAEAQKLKKQWNRHSRVPVYDKKPDNIVGIVLRKDVLLSAAKGREERTLAALKKDVHFVPESARLNSVFLEFFDQRQHLFVVVDEYGSVGGVISLEDIIEEIVGLEIIDESDQDKTMRDLARDKRKKLLTATGINQAS